MQPAYRVTDCFSDLLRAERRGFDFRWRHKYFFYSQGKEIGSGAHPHPSQFVLEVFATGRELTVYMYGTEVQNAWRYNSPFPYIVMSDD
jgi:hypothetical protein